MIAFLGGTFDPIHYGHLKIASLIKKKYRVNKLLIIPCGNPVHKKKNIL